MDQQGASDDDKDDLIFIEEITFKGIRVRDPHRETRSVLAKLRIDIMKDAFRTLRNLLVDCPGRDQGEQTRSEAQPSEPEPN